MDIRITLILFYSRFKLLEDCLLLSFRNHLILISVYVKQESTIIKLT